MAKKNCCCTTCEWCDHDHFSIDYYNAGAPDSRNGNLNQDTQRNWNDLGTVTTELPSIGHPMARISFQSCPDFIPLIEDTRNPGFYKDNNPCCQDVPPPVGIVVSDDPSKAGQTYSTLRTPLKDLEVQSLGWGRAFYYGEICPAWFNGINMTNVMGEDDVFFNFTFELKIEKKINNSYETIIDIKRNGPGFNVHPHPDACHSFNVNDPIVWRLLSGCDAFFDVDEDGNYTPCVRDFARMPRGPWPYRFQPHIDIDKANQNCRSSTGQFYTKQEVEEAKAGLIKTDGSYTAFRGGTVGPDILNCNLYQQKCQSGPSIVEQPRCCGLPYLDPTEYCDRLDPNNGTPFGWEDCPVACASYSMSGLSNQSIDTSNLHFFGWWNPVNRYTTPEWDFYEGISGSCSGICGGIDSKKLSLNVIVPTAAPIYPQTFCQFDGTDGYGFSEWSFGMDYEAPNEIAALESAGFVWSNGVEQDGVWINQTPTNALRVLFTLDHSDLDQGKVWRVFRDWDVEVTNLVKTFNANTPNESKFRITLKQKVKEIQFSSMGCDCPSGYTIVDGKITPTEPACGIHYSTNPYGGFTSWESPNNICWESNIDGPYSNNVGSRVSFSERGPVAIKMKLSTTETGCQACNRTHANPSGYQDCTNKFGSVTRSGDNEHSGQILIVGTQNVCYDKYVYYNNQSQWPEAVENLHCINRTWEASESLPTYACKPAVVEYSDGTPSINDFVNNWFIKNGSRLNDALGDIPYSPYEPTRSVTYARYRNTYAPVYMSPSAIENELTWGDRYPELIYHHLYSHTRCHSTCPNTTWDYKYIYNTASTFINPYPSEGPIGYCIINCGCLPGDIQTTSTSDDVVIQDPCYGWDERKWGPCPYYGGFCAGSSTTTPCPCDFDGCDRRGPYDNPNYNCGTNLASQNNPGGDITKSCDPYPAQGDIIPFCDLETVPEYCYPFGLDGDRIYFTAFGQASTYTGLGSVGCAKTCACNDTNQTGGCYDEQGRCKFCKGACDAVGYGFYNNTFINWKKYLCDKRYNENYKIPVDIMSNFTWTCDKIGNIIDDSYGGITFDGGCDYAWSKQSCVAANVGIQSYSSVKKLIENNSNLHPTYKVELSKYYDTILDPWCPWDTKYRPNPGRAGLSGGRNHVIINAKGPL